MDMLTVQVQLRTLHNSLITLQLNFRASWSDDSSAVSSAVCVGRWSRCHMHGRSACSVDCWSNVA